MCLVIHWADWLRVTEERHSVHPIAVTVDFYPLLPRLHMNRECIRRAQCSSYNGKHDAIMEMWHILCWITWVVITFAKNMRVLFLKVPFPLPPAVFWRQNRPSFVEFSRSLIWLLSLITIVFSFLQLKICGQIILPALPETRSWAFWVLGSAQAILRHISRSGPGRAVTTVFHVRDILNKWHKF